MPNLVKPLRLGAHAFFLKYRQETRDEDMLMFHAHQGIELLYIYEGTGTVTLEGRHYELKPNTLFCFQPYQLHKVDVKVKVGSKYQRSNVTFDPYILNTYLESYPQLQSFLRYLMNGSLKRQVFEFFEDSTLENLLSNFDQVRRLSNGELNPEYRVLFLLSLLKYLQIHVFKITDTNSFIEKTTGHIEKILDWVDNHFRQSFLLEALSQELHLSSYHVSRLFKQQFGMTLSAYVSGRRIREACMLLENTDHSIHEIGRMVGGFSAPYFSQLFKKHKGLTPNMYRSTIQQTYHTHKTPDQR